ncbi:MAG TPA: TlpA disulfide reductase family protein [Chitinophagaceae bacterium]|nr:TlpA disulfide reductase family protein [Chitinophagaceae bacterium]
MINREKFFLPVLFFLVSLGMKAQPRYGQDAYEIALPSVTGDTIRLSDFKGKVVLLDFWASWCPPCRASNKRLTKLYPHYRDKGFEIFSVSIDDDIRDWKRAMMKDKVSWLEVIDSGGWDSPSAVQWRIDAIPASYLIDKNGKVIAMDPDRKELEKMLKNLLGS